MPIGLVGASLIGTGVGTAARVYGARQQSRASQQAAAAENQAAQQALDYQREQDAYERQRQEDETQYQRSRDALADTRYADQRDYSRGQYANYLTRLRPYASVGPTALGEAQDLLRSPMTSGGAIMVRLRAPNGKESPVPAALVDHYLRRGAQRVE